MKNLLYLAAAIVMMLTAACSGKGNNAGQNQYDPHFDMAFVNAFNDTNVSRADSAFALLDSISPANRTYLALFYAQSSDQSFENSQRFMENAIKAYKSAMAADTAAVNGVFELFGKEYRLTVPEIHASFSRNERILNGIEEPDSYTINAEPEQPVDSVVAEVPEQTIEEAVNSVQ